MKNRQKNSWILLLTVLLSFNSWSLFATEINDLRVEYLKNPVGIDVTQPRFSWKMQSDERGASQTAYEIVVSTDPASADVIWNSGPVASGKSVHILYEGPVLSPATRYYWKVNVWNQKSEKITSSETAFFETGLMNSGWSNAQWIKAPEITSGGNVRFDLDLDMTLLQDNAGIIFSAKDATHFYMWSINTHDAATPIIRRHFYDGSFHVSESAISSYTKSDLLNHERHVKIEADGNTIKTYIDNVLVDTHVDTYNQLVAGGTGFRASNDNLVNERALYDNVVLTVYNDGQSTVQLSNDFENGSNAFVDAETIVVEGNTQLNVFSSNGEQCFWDDSLNGIPLFRTEFGLDKAVRSARLYSSGLGIYEVFINGKRIGTRAGDQVIRDEFKPGWTDYSKTIFYTTHDVSGWLKQGANAIGAQVSSGWWNGAISHGEYGNVALGFRAKLVVEYTDGTSTVLVTDPQTWKTSTEGPVRKGAIYDGETYDARKESNWTSAGFDDSNWYPSVLNTDFKGQIKAFTAPPVQVRPELEKIPVTITKYDGITATGTTYGMINSTETKTGQSTITLHKGETLVYDLGQNMVGWVHFKVHGDAGTKMKIRFAEILNDNGAAERGNDGPGGSLYRIALRGAKATLYYTLKGDANGEEFHPSTTFFGFRYCDITATQDMEIESLVGQVVGTVAEEGSSFSTSDTNVNQLYSNVLWGQRGNFLSIPTDCPQRDERLGWAGDIQIFGRAATYNADLASFFHKWMGDMRDSQRSDGAYPSVAPYTWGVPYGAAAWAEAGLVVPWNTYLMYDDRGILEENYESMEKYMTFLSNQKFDGYLYNGAGTDYGDWVAYVSTDSRYISVCYYAYAALLMEKISNALSNSPNDEYAQKAASYKTVYDNIKAEFNKRYVRSDGTQKGSLSISTQTSHLLALRLGLFPDDEARAKGIEQLNQLIVSNGNKLNTGFVGTGTLNQTLSDVGLINTAYNLLLQRNNPSWLYSVDQGATTIWERWNSYTVESGFHKDISMNSFNHYSYGAVLEWMYRYMAGINPDESQPGFKHIILNPLPDFRETRPAGQNRITQTDASYHSYYGKIRSAWTIDPAGNSKYDISVPANTTASLVLLLNSNLDDVLEGEVNAAEAEGVVSYSVENGKAFLELQSGNYSFTVRNRTAIQVTQYGH
jgi:alpha-L-rhamnosidase